MSYCEALSAAISAAPTDDARAQLQALYDAHCTGAGSGGTTQPDGGGPHKAPVDD